MLGVDPINVIGVGVQQSLARSGNVAETLERYNRHASLLVGGGGSGDSFGGGRWSTENLDQSQPSLAAASLPTTHIPPFPTTQATLSIRVGNQHSFVKAN